MVENGVPVVGETIRLYLLDRDLARNFDG